MSHDTDQTIDAEHGCVETQHCSILPVSEFLMKETLEPWKCLNTIIRIQATREVKGKTMQETRYYISDEKN